MSDNKIPRMTDEALKDFVIRFCNGSIFTSLDIEARGYIKDPRMVSMVFMPLAFGGLKDLPKDELNKIGLIWEDMSQAGPRAINGMPIFMSCGLMHIEDWERARKAIKTEMERREAIEV